MIKRFEGEEGKRRLINNLLEFKLVGNDQLLSEKLADVGEIVFIRKGEVFITENEYDNDVYFILVGETDVSVKGRHWAVRKAGEVVGEMSIAETSPRSATLTAITDMVLLKVSEPNFLKLASEHGQIWKPLYHIIRQRLDQQMKLVNAPNENPVLFIGSSAESIPTAEEINLQLSHSHINVRIWTGDVFDPSGITIDDLLNAAKSVDFAAFLFTPDDKVVSRHHQDDAPRDNVIFELGLFMGRLGRERTFIIKDYDHKIKIPSDLLGITIIDYVHKPGRSFESEIQVVCTKLKKKITQLGTL